MNLTPIQTIALAKILADTGSKETLNAALDRVGPGEHEFNFVVHLDGSFTKATDVPNGKPTTSIPFTIVCALLIRRMGITREKALEYLAEAIPEAVKMGKAQGSARKAILAQQGVTEALARFDAEVTSKLPRQHKRGAVRMQGAEAEALVECEICGRLSPQEVCDVCRERAAMTG